MKPCLQFLAIITILVGCAKVKRPPENNPSISYHEFKSYEDFKTTLTNIASMEDPLERENSLSILWDSLKFNKQIPFVNKDSVAFLYKGDSDSVYWAGDFSGWKPVKGFQFEKTNVWMLEKKFPLDARLDYKVVQDSIWTLDPDNSYVQYSGWGPNSELRMPDWKYPQETILIDGVNRGNLSDNKIISASPKTLGYNLQYKVYTPFGYEDQSNLSTIYVTDGQEYADERLGSMLTILDNLIYQNKIDPIIVIFIDPRNPDNLRENRRADQYRGNLKFANFVADELAPIIDSNYNTNSSADARAILGTSYGGWNAGYFGVARSDKFHLIAIHSPAFDTNVIDSYSNSELLPLKIFMSTGVINDTEDKTRSMKTVLDAKGYPLHYIEVNEGHSWGNWRALTEESLVYFFRK